MGREEEARPIAWHTLAPETVFDRLATGPQGLSETEARRRFIEIGPNRLRPPRPVSWWRLLLNQLESLVVLLLIVAAAAAAIFGDLLEAGAIATVLVINTAIGFVMELRARRAMDALLQYEVPTSNVIREGQVRRIASDLIVPGDVLDLHEGDRVPADARLLTAVEVYANEAPLTGESRPVRKSAESIPDPGTLLAERSSMVYCGTLLYVGHASAVVVDTGAATVLGRIGTLVAGVESAPTPLERRLDELGTRLLWLTLGVAALVSTLGVLRGSPLGRMIETGVALAISAVPEGLPAVATIALAVGLRRMARRHALVRKLSAVEALGATTVVCTDKTGTLTTGRMTVTEMVGAGTALRVTAEGFASSDATADANPLRPDRVSWLRRLLVACALTSRASVAADGSASGDPTDAALTIVARRAGIEATSLLAALPQVRDIPFTSARKASASVHRDGTGLVLFAKGAPATILESCSRWADNNSESALDAVSRRAIQRDNERLAARGLRIIALAEGRGDDLRDLTFLGLVGITDPPAEGVRETIALLRHAGIHTVMITGDQRTTAEAIARDLGMLESHHSVVDGRDLEAMTEEQIASREQPIGVFSRVSPQDKLRIVSALQARGEVVAMLGDGVNDAAALKKADVGVAMGERGTDVAKEAAAIVLSDDRFPTIGAAVEEGRVIFDNILKFVFYLFSCNVAEVLVLFLASGSGLPSPLLPLQILWLNIVTDTFPALALALEPSEPGVMQRPPRRPDAAIVSGSFLGAILFYGALITVATLGAYLWALERGDPSRAVTIAFMTLALAQLFHLGNARAREPVLSWRRATANRWALVAVPVVIGLQLLAVYAEPLAHALRTSRLGPADWLVVFGASVIPAVVGQAVSATRTALGQRTASPL